MSTDLTVLKLHTHQALETKCFQRGSKYRTVIAIGGIRSGKTLTLARWMIDRGQWDTSQFHGLFANTVPQRDSAILGEVLPWVELAGIEWSWNKRPPKEWIERWRKLGIKTPPRQPRYTNVLILSSGLHIYCGTMSNRSYRQIKGMKFGSVVIEEVCAGATEEAIRYIFERVNCGRGAKCVIEHHHVKILHSNPPDDDGHWIYDWLTRLEQQAAKKAGVKPSSDNDSFPCLLRGVSDTIYIPSRTADNAGNLPPDFIDDMANTVDEETAKKVLDGVLTRTRKGRVYNAFSHANQIDSVPYDPDRTLYVALDFNRNPAVALYAHQLNPGEYPKEHERPNIKHIGVFGEVFHVGGMDAEGLCSLLLTGGPGSDGSLPKEFKGLANHRGRVVFFGDATAANLRMAGNEWQIVDKVCGEALKGRYARNVPDKNPLVPLGVHAVNAKCKSATGITSLWFHSRVKHLIQDMLTNAWHKTDPSKIYKAGVRGGSSLWMTTHLGDALRYLIATLFPLGRDGGDGADLPNIPFEKFKEPRLI